MLKNSKPIRIMLASHSHELTGGAELSLLQIIEHLHESSRFELFVVLPYTGSFQKKLNDLGVKNKVVKYSWWANKSKLAPHNLTSHHISPLRNIIKLCNSWRPDVIVTNTSVIPWFGFAGKLLGIPHVWMLREFIGENFYLKYSPSAKEALRQIDESSSVIIVNSKAMKQYYLNSLGSDKIEVFYPTFKESILKHRRVPEATKDLSDPIKIIAIGAITETKGQLDLIKAAGILKSRNVPFEITIMGKVVSEKYFAKIKSAIKEMGVSKYVTVRKFASSFDPIVADHDVCVITSYKESFGRFTVEAMLLGKAVVATINGGSKDIIEPGKGLLYEPGSYRDLANILEDLILKKDKILSLSKDGHGYAVSKFLDPSSYDKLFDIFAKASRNKPTSSTVNQVLVEEMLKSEKHQREVIRQKTIVHEKNLEIIRLTNKVNSLEKSLAKKILGKVVRKK
jgi:glycosyltransferase involved in cell wall biosynthesis